MPMPNESCQLFDLSEYINLRNPINKSNLKYKPLSGNLNSDTSTIIVLKASVYEISDWIPNSIQNQNVYCDRFKQNR